MTSQTWPAHGTAAARTVTYGYAGGNNPLVNNVAEGTSTVTSGVDLLGRVTAYIDAGGDYAFTAYDQAGRVTNLASAAGNRVQNYDPATGRQGSVVLDGSTVSQAPVYESTTGRLRSVMYSNGILGRVNYDLYGRVFIRDAYNQSSNVTIDADYNYFSLAGRVVDQLMWNGTALVDATPAAGQNSYVYDGAGRLTSAAVPGFAAGYGYSATTGCPANNAGANTNRTAYSTFTTTFTLKLFCYDNADRLVSGTDYPVGSIVYDDHGNTIQLGDQALDYDAADRHVRTETPTSVTRYARDPLDRIVTRTDITNRIAHIAWASPRRPDGGYEA